MELVEENLPLGTTDGAVLRNRHHVRTWSPPSKHERGDATESSRAMMRADSDAEDAVQLAEDATQDGTIASAPATSTEVDTAEQGADTESTEVTMPHRSSVGEEPRAADSQTQEQDKQKTVTPMSEGEDGWVQVADE